MLKAGVREVCRLVGDALVEGEEKFRYRETYLLLAGIRNLGSKRTLTRTEMVCASP